MSNLTEPGAGAPNAAGPAASPKIWGYVATFAWVILVHLLATIATVGALHLWNPAGFPLGLTLPESLTDARYVSTTTLIANAIQVALLFGIARLARWRPTDYLALVWPSRREVAIGLIVFIALLPLLDAFAYLAGQPIIPPFMVDIYRNAQSTDSLLLLWLAIVIAAPVAEEIIFRGFIFRSWVRSVRYPALGILAVSIVFAIVHIQYNWFGVFQVFLIGLTLTWLRWYSGSTLLPMALHVLANFYAMMQTVVLLHWLAPAAP
jgi:membrane protease YdiL (CAAX protease family)